jgi:hypothetical protein
MTTFAEGLLVQYKDHIGTIRFICDSYVTMCVSPFPDEKRRDVCILIYRDSFKEIKLFKESQK